MSSNRLRRIAKEIDETVSDTFSKIHLHPAHAGNDLTHLEGHFIGPPDTPYEGGQYYIDIRIPNDYPFRPPNMRFITKIWHPNVSSQTGAICLDTLSTGWSPVFTIKAALISIQGLLASPEPKDPQDAEVAGMLLKNPKEFAEVARKWAVLYARAPEEDKSNSKEGEAQESQKVDEETRAEKEKAAKKASSYRGYNHSLVDRFCDMGFDVSSVVAAFERAGVERHGGQDYEMDDGLVGDITSRLFGES